MSAGGAPRARGHVWLVGAGPGDPRMVTVAGLEALRAAEVVLYDRLAPQALLDEAPPEALRIDAGKSAGDHAMTQDEINAALIEHASLGRRVVRLKGGDPFVFGRGGEEALAVAAAGLGCTVIPGITSAIGGLAAAGIPITHRALASSFLVVTGHEDPTKPSSAVDWSRLATAADTVVILMGAARLDAIAHALIEGGRAPSTPAAVVQSASTPRQRTVLATLEDIAAVASREGIRAPALFVVGDVAALAPRIAAAPGPLAGKRVLVTRSRRQSSTLVRLLADEGAHAIELPAIELTRRAEPGALAAALEALRAGAYRWTVFTSANAVEVTLDLLRDLGSDARAFARTRLCAIGPATTAALAARGLRADLEADETIGEGVLAALARDGDLEGSAVLLPRAEGARSALPDGLRAAGARVDEVTLYLAAPPAAAPPEALELVRAGAIDAVAFTSSSTVRNLLELLGPDFEALRGAAVVCIGPETARAAEAHGFSPSVVAAAHTVPGLVEALRGWYLAQDATRAEAKT